MVKIYFIAKSAQKSLNTQTTCHQVDVIVHISICVVYKCPQMMIVIYLLRLCSSLDFDFVILIQTNYIPALHSAKFYRHNHHILFLFASLLSVSHTDRIHGQLNNLAKYYDVVPFWALFNRNAKINIDPYHSFLRLIIFEWRTQANTMKTFFFLIFIMCVCF